MGQGTRQSNNLDIGIYSINECLLQYDYNIRKHTLLSEMYEITNFEIVAEVTFF